MVKAKPDLSVTVGDLKLKNPLIMASGELGRVARGLIKYAEYGCAAVTSKSILPLPWGGNPAPWNIYFERTETAGSPGDPGVGFKAFVPEVKKAKEAIKDSAFVVVNIDPNELEEVVEMAVGFEKAGADALEIKPMGCPNYKPDPTKPPNKIATGYWASTPERLETIIKAVKSAVKIPVWVKLTPVNIQNIRALERAGADALTSVCGGGFGGKRSLIIDVDTGKPVLGDPAGTGLGESSEYRGLKGIADLVRATRIPLVPSGGVQDAKDIIAYIMCGATAVQSYKSLAKGGPKLAKRMLDGIEEYMIEKGIGSLDEIRGITLKYLPPVTTAPEVVTYG